MADLKAKIQHIFTQKKTIDSKLQEVCNLLKEQKPFYDWVGFYFKNGNKNELKLAQFAGKPTEHVIIPFGKGICGQVAVSNENFIVEDVTQQDNYISCGMDVRSEIVIPIFKKDKNIGQIDIDSHTVNAFNNEDATLLEFVCQLVSDNLPS